MWHTLSSWDCWIYIYRIYNIGNIIYILLLGVMFDLILLVICWGICFNVWNGLPYRREAICHFLNVLRHRGFLGMIVGVYGFENLYTPILFTNSMGVPLGPLWVVLEAVGDHSGRSKNS